jgi:hypothetical protein
MVKATPDFSVYPNPLSSENLNITLPVVPQTDINFSIKTLNGLEKHRRLIPKEKFDGVLPLDESVLSCGSYLLEIQVNGTTLVKKFSVK